MPENLFDKVIKSDKPHTPGALARFFNDAIGAGFNMARTGIEAARDLALIYKDGVDGTGSKSKKHKEYHSKFNL